ncbi:MAG: hypothetical protein M1816_006428 [Peltula sp. TS41687]|nr:MAG: hypothetical protein M1816_006428 [Peltula sp. TS41687]
MAPALLETRPAASPIKSIIHPPSNPAKRKRAQANLDETDAKATTSSAKRAKVSFHPDVQDKLAKDWEGGIDHTREDVQQAIVTHKLGENAGYTSLLKVFTTNPTDDDAPSATTLENHVLALISITTQLNKSCSGLVHAILASEWLGRDDTYVFLFIRFMGNLLSAHVGYVDAALRMLVDNLASVPSSAGRLPGYYPVDRPHIYIRAHIALKYLLEVVPSSSSALLAILSARFPHHSSSKKAHTDYVRNLLKVTEYVPQLTAEILALITERLVKIDVQVQVDMDDLDEGAEEKLVRKPLQKSEDDNYDSDDDSVSSDGSTSSLGSVDEETRRVKVLRSNVEKMDIILDSLFEFYSQSFTDDSDDVDWAFDVLAHHFATIILPTYRSRHSQFLLFHFAQTSELLIDKFAGECVALAFEKSRPALLRHSAAAYMASFVARGAHVPAEVVRNVFQLLGIHLEQFRADHETSCYGPDLRRYGTFYSLVQALLYIFCFRWRDLVVHPDGGSAGDEETAIAENQELSWTPGVKDTFTQAIYSKFNPLKVCSPSIVNEFARIANHLRFMYVYPLLESNKRVHLSRSTGPRFARGRGSHAHPVWDIGVANQRDESHLQLDAYFPFDPYHLPTSKRWLKGDYVEWRGIPGLDDDDDEEDDPGVDDDKGEEEDEEGAEEEDGHE